MQAVSRFSSIRMKLWLGFGLVLSIFSISTAITLVSLDGVNHHVEGVVTVKQPTLLKAKDLTIHLKQATVSLGFYLLTKEDYHLNDYAQGIEKTKEVIQSLRQAAADYPGINYEQLVNSLNNDIALFEKTAQTLLEKTSSYEENFPGIAFANQHINPLNRIIMQLSSQMIMSEMEESSDDERKQILADLAELRYSWSQVMNGIRGYLAFRNDNNIRDMNLYIDKSESLLQKLSQQEDLLTLDQADSLEQFLSNIVDFKQHYQKLLEIHGSEQWRSDAWLVRSEFSHIIQSIQHNLDTLISHLQTSIKQTSDTLMEDTRSVFNLIIGLLVIGLIAGFAISWFISRTISKPITDAAMAMQNIADGDGNLMKSLDESNRNELGQLAASFNVFVGKIRNLIKQTAHSTESVIEAVAETSDNTGQIIKRILDQEQETDQVATAMNQMATCISDVAQNASIAEEAAETANKETRNGCAIVEETAVAIQELAKEVELAEQSIQNVEQESIRIGSVLDVIKSIAEQTNLLALNAAIEAARAGEQGRGFAVVADEVRSLATRTHESTGEIQSMIQSLQSGTQHAVSVMATGREKVEVNVHQANETLKSLGTISNAVETINQMNTQIATAAEEQCAVAEEINKNICNISDSSKQNAHKATATAETVDSLGSLAATLQNVVQQFKFSGDSGLDFSAAKSAHLAWKARLRSFLDGKESLSHKEAVSHHDCVLGKWYYGDGLSQYSDIPEMRAIEQPHQEMHKLIKEIIQCKEKGQHDQAETLYADISPLSTRIIQLLGQVEQAIDSNN